MPAQPAIPRMGGDPIIRSAAASRWMYQPRGVRYCAVYSYSLTPCWGDEDTLEEILSFTPVNTSTGRGMVGSKVAAGPEFWVACWTRFLVLQIMLGKEC